MNHVGLRRAGWTLPQRQEVKRAFRLVYLEGLNVKQALAQADGQSWGPEAAAFFEFIAAASKKGICALRHSAEEPGAGTA